LATRQFFAAVQGKGESETNLRQNNLLETAVSFRTQGLAIDVQNFRSVNVLNIPLFLEHSSISFQVGEKRYWSGPMRFVSGRLWTDQAGTVNAVHQQHGMSAVASAIWTGKHVVDINPLQNFRVIWITENMSAADVTAATPAANTRLRYVCSLKGLKRRPVQ